MGAGAGVNTNYTVSGSGVGTLAANPDSVAGAGATYVLTWDCPAIMKNGGDILITVNTSVTDDIGNPIGGNTGTDLLGAMATLPVVTLTPDVATVDGECGVALTLPTATYADECGTVLTGNPIVSVGLDTGNPAVGVYTVTYSAVDAALNVGTRDVTVNITDNVVPVITLNGANPQVVQLNDPYVELGAIAADDCDGDLSGSIIIDASAVNTLVEATYQVTYDVDDAEGNSALTVTRDVQVINGALPLSVAPIADIEVADGATGVLSAVVSGGTGTITYVWSMDDGTGTFVALVNGGGYSGVDTATLTLDPFAASMAGLYKVEVTDDLTTVETTVTVTLDVPGVPVAGGLGLVALALAAALGGAAALRRRK
jgi:hypothetical protein